VDDLFLDVADLGRHDRSTVEAGLEPWNDPVPCEIPISLLVDTLGHEKGTAEAVALAEPLSIVQVTTTSSPTY